MNDSPERVAVFWECATWGYEEVTVQEPADVVARPAGAADHAAGPYFLYESATAIRECGAEIVGCGGGLGAVILDPNHRAARTLTCEGRRIL